jgi:hypothetical protein
MLSGFDDRRDVRSSHKPQRFGEAGTASDSRRAARRSGSERKQETAAASAAAGARLLQLPRFVD